MVIRAPFTSLTPYDPSENTLKQSQNYLWSIRNQYKVQDGVYVGVGSIQ